MTLGNIENKINVAKISKSPIFDNVMLKLIINKNTTTVEKKFLVSLLSSTIFIIKILYVINFNCLFSIRLLYLYL